MKQSRVNRLVYSGTSNYDGEAILRVVTGNPAFFLPSDQKQAIFVRENQTPSSFSSSDFENRLFIGQELDQSVSGKIVCIPDDSLSLDDGDVVHIYSVGHRVRLTILFRIASDDNILIPTNRCNNACIMCPQPPTRFHFQFSLSDMKRIICLIDPSTKYVGISGGEPTLMKQELVELLSTCGEHLPRTKIALLTNGRMLSYPSFVDHINSVGIRDLTFCIPLHSHQADVHDDITKVAGSFQQTTRGINNLLNRKNKVEIRIVIQKANYANLPAIATYITQNFPSVDRVVFMGMEASGQAARDIDRVWVNLSQVCPFLEQAAITLLSTKIGVAIYNIPLCKIGTPFRALCADSISDYKIRYLPECNTCDMKIKCGGIFAASERLLKAEGVLPISGPTSSTTL